MTSLHDPHLSVVVQIQRDTEQFQLMLRSIRAQSVCRQLELIIVTPPDLPLSLQPDVLAPLWGYQVQTVDPPTSEGKAKTVGVVAARAPLVAFAEDHSYPAPGWAQAMIDTHNDLEQAAVVGPLMDNANPDSAVSWGCFLIYYGQWLAAGEKADVSHLPANQSCYKRHVLLTYGSHLKEMLQAESVLHWDLAKKGHQVVLDPSARVYHLNYSQLTLALREYFWASRIFAANRASGWRSLRRALYALGSPLLPALRLSRVLKETRRAAMKTAVVGRAVAPAMLILCAGAVGELLGYGAGSGAASDRLAAMFRDGHLTTPADLRQVVGLQQRASERSPGSSPSARGPRSGGTWRS